MIADYSLIKIAISSPFRNANVTNEDHRQIAAKSRQKLHEIIGQKFTKFVHDVA